MEKEEVFVKYLEELGTDNQIIAQLKESDKDLNVKELADEFKASQKEVYANNPDLIKKLEKEAAGKARGSVEREIKRVTNITPEEWEENGFSEEKNYKKVLEFGIEKIKKDGNKTAQEIQDEKTELANEIRRIKEEEIPQLNVSWQKKIDRTDIERHYRKLIGESGDLIISAEDASVIVGNALSDKGYSTELNEGRTDISFKTKDGLVPQDEEGTRNLTPKEVVKSILDGKKLVKQSNALPDPKPKPQFKQSDSSPDTNIHPKARENLEKVSKLERVPRVTKVRE